jgi:drug/metabolite transporter (DMT)-like permease
MSSSTEKKAPVLMVVVAFATLYIVWGSTYFFIRVAIQHIPALLMASMRYTIAGSLMLLWCVIRGEKLFVWKDMWPAIISGLILLFIGNGAIVWVEQYLASSFVAVFAAAAPIWFVILDKRNWEINFKSKETVIGLVIGFIGVLLLFSENASHVLSASGNKIQIVALGVLLVGSMAWAGGSLYSKYNSTGPSNSVNSAWQMLAAGIAFIPCSYISGEWHRFHWQQVTSTSWLAVLYLITLGSLAGYSAYVWLLQVRPATQVSTHAYVNPLVAVLLGVFFAGEKMSGLQITGLAIILISVLLVNLAKYRKVKHNSGTIASADEQPKINRPVQAKSLESKSLT